METFFLLLGAVIGTVFITVFLRSALRSLRQSDWKVVPGRVIRAFVEETQGMNSSRNFSACVLYGYSYGGRELQGRTTLGNSHMGKSNAEEIVSRYSPGLTLSVYVYEPDPTESKLEPGVNVLAFGASAFGAGFVVFAIYRAGHLLHLW